MYAKLFSSVVYSSLWSEPSDTRIVFLTLLALADRRGFVFTSRPGLQRLAVVSREVLDKALDTLEGPDRDSSDLLRNPENDGRRIERVDGGWRLINYDHYRAFRDMDERRHQDAERKRKSRKSENERESGTSANVTLGHARSAAKRKRGKSQEIRPSEAEAEADTEATERVPRSTPVGVHSGTDNASSVGSSITAQSAPSGPAQGGPPGAESEAHETDQAPEPTMEELLQFREMNRTPVPDWTADQVDLYAKFYPEHREQIHRQNRPWEYPPPPEGYPKNPYPPGTKEPDRG